LAKYKSSTNTSKWTKTKWLLDDEKLQAYVPETKQFNLNSLTEMCEKYPTVYFKPTNGTGGSNIYRITIQEKGFLIKHNISTVSVSTIESLFNKLKKFAKKKSYIVQQGIALEKTKGNPFDLRIMIQKPKKVWIPSAIFSKVGKPGKVVTNYHQGGRLATLKNTLKGANFSPSQIKETENRLKQLSLDVGHCFDKHRRNFRNLA
jgi:glutathione synthase/RimK-type ligase-like ATP-grasp enzyme